MRIIDKIDKIFINISMICLFSIMVILAVDGLGRHFFNAPINGAYVLVEKYLMVAMIFPAIGYTWSKKGHIGVTLVLQKMPYAVQNITYLLTILFGLGIFGLIGYTGYEATYTAFIQHQVTSGLIRWPLWLAYIWMFIGSAIFCLRLIIEFIICLMQIGQKGLNNFLLNPDLTSHESAD